MSLYDALGSDTLSTLPSNFLFFLCHSTLHKAWAARRSSKAKTFSALEEIALGSIAGMAAKLVVTPISQITVRQQSTSSRANKVSAKVRGKAPEKAQEDSDSEDEEAGENSITQICNDIIAERGWRGFWSGYKSAAMLSLMPSLTMYIFALLKILLLPKSKREHPPIMITFLTSASAGGVAAALTYPLILAKTRLQSRSSSGKRQYTSATDCLQKIYARYGLKGIYTGLQVQILKTFFSQGITLLFKERIELLFILALLRARRGRLGPLAKA